MLAIACRITGTVTGNGGDLDSPGSNAVPMQWMDDGQGGGWWEQMWWNPGGINADGSYEIGGLAPGTYRVGFFADPAVWAFEVWNNKLSPMLGDDIVLAPGETRTGIDADLAPAAHIKGRVTSDGTTGIANVTVAAGPFDVGTGMYEHIAWTNTDAEGYYDLSGLPAGTFRVQFMDDAGIYLSEYYDDVRDWTEATDITLAAGGERTGIDAVLSPLPPNSAPVLDAIGDKSVNQGSTLSFTATATDADSDPLVFSLGAGAPSGASITPDGAFSWTPDAAGAYPVTVVVSDGKGGTDSETFTVTVLALTRFEQTHAYLTFSGPWATTSSPSLSGGSYASGTSTATVLVSFTGTGIDLVGTKSRWGGMAEVSVDGGPGVLIDFYAASTAHQQVVWGVADLTYGPHTLAVTSSWRRNASSSGGMTYIDAFDVRGTLTQAPSRIQQTDARLTWTGSWVTGTSPNLSGGSYTGGTPGSTMLFSFTGTGAELIGTLSPYGGVAEVSVDGGAPTEADFFGGPATSHKRKVWSISGLSDGPHTIALTQTVKRSPGSAGGMVYVDALDVAGTLLQAPTRYQQTDARIGLAGPWTTTSSTSLSGGSYAAGTSGAVLTLRFTGTGADLIGTLSPWGGISTVSLDGAAPEDVDFYGPATSHKRKVWGVSGLAPGPHTVRLVVTSRRNASSLGGNAYVDAFDVSGTLLAARFEQTDPLISFAGPWTTTESPSLSGGSYAGGTAGATLSLSFTGTSIELVGTKSLYGGIATVSLDGGPPVDADFYAATTLHKQRVWGATGLGAGTHTLTLSVTSRRNALSLGGNAYVDAFDIAGALVE